MANSSGLSSGDSATNVQFSPPHRSLFSFGKKMTLACPGCGFRTIGEDFYGSYTICPVCGWEDDAVQLANPCSGGGANKESLVECQKRVATSSKEQSDGFERDPDWRPLSEEEVLYFTSVAARKHWTFMGETSPELAYWRQPPKMEAQ